MNQSEKSLPAEEYLPNIFLCQSDNMYITIPKNDIDFPSPGAHSHKGYEFIMPLTDIPYMGLDEKVYSGCKNTIIPINPGQEHGFVDKIEKVRFIDIFIDHDYMVEMANSVYNKKDLEFCFGNYPVSGQLMTMIKMFEEESRMNAPGKSMQLQSLSSLIAVLLLRDIKNNMHDTDLKISGTDNHRIKLAVDYIHDNYKSDFSLDDLSNAAGMSRYHFIRVFKNTTGKTPYDYVLDIKIEKAKSLLAKKDTSIVEVCFESGFNNISHFTSVFKKRVGITPSLYRSMMID